MTVTRPLLAITLGDPAGIGPLVGARAALDPALRRRSRPLLVGDAWILHRLLHRRGIAVKPLPSIDDYLDRPGVANVLHVPHPEIRTLRRGAAQRVGGESAALSIRAAVALALAGRVAAVVTGPASKESFRLAGLPHPGHTEMLAALCGIDHVEMVMAAGRRRTVLITRHLPLKDVSAALTTKKIIEAVLRVDAWGRTHLGLRKRPRWILCGLNPHAGDGGLLGREEIRTVAPAAAALRKKGLPLLGPWPADVAWARHAAGESDFVASLYHDQGMIPLKTLDGRRLVNVTVGLPFVRTSPGHGTAFDLAAGPRAEAMADAEPTLEAARVALDLAPRNPR